MSMIPPYFGAGQIDVGALRSGKIMYVYDAQSDTFVSAPQPLYRFNIDNENERIALLFARMRVPEGTRPFEGVHTHLTDSKENVIVFIVVRSKAVMFEDLANIFPSDGLVAQLNLLAAATKK